MTLEEEIQRAHNKISSIELLLLDDSLRPEVLTNNKVWLANWQDELKLALEEYSKVNKK